MGSWQGLRAGFVGAAPRAAGAELHEGSEVVPAGAAVSGAAGAECCALGAWWAALRAAVWGGREAAGSKLREGNGFGAARTAVDGGSAAARRAADLGGRDAAGLGLREGGAEADCCALGAWWAALRAAIFGGREAVGAGLREGSGFGAARAAVSRGAGAECCALGAWWGALRAVIFGGRRAAGTLLLLVVAAAGLRGQPVFSVEKIFAPETWHNHSSSVVELPNGDLFVVWFHGSGERQSDDVLIEGARWRKASGTWSARFPVADTPGFPDTNCVVYLDSQKRLWLLWPVILANTWESALMKYRISTDYQQADGPPVWGFADNLLVIPSRMAERTKEVMQRELTRPGPFGDWARRSIGLAEDKLFSRLGWFTRTHPIELPSGRMLVPLYSDGFSFGLMAISDDKGKTWKGSEPIVGFGNIQPSVVRRQNGELVAYMRDNGPAPKRIMMSVSKDDGMSWSPAADTELFNPGASVEAIRLRDGKWLLVYNDLERGRGSLAASLSDDEGRTWKWTRHIATGPGQYHYPSVIQGADGMIHVTFSQHEREGEKNSKTIAHARFSVDWVMGR